MCQGCITNVNVTTGCWRESHFSGICYCKTDLCNKDKWSDFQTGQVLAPADCIQKEKEIQCDRILAGNSVIL
ncbi:hypothetical protein PRIPAC_83818 [Pristionchus pacificus]|uniref:Uncharacterized protein n=1 Tax=Pristionchus pacificus TaxID=54126 RepID=A0A2A6BU45_PRIPA|nr:hypothetical protein PRIPAC_83818 [Pristionchus pacificus]|eukprot:PDM69333.1 hypothetical protein PRIPAC_47635 [Pristionchus pacificus]